MNESVVLGGLGAPKMSLSAEGEIMIYYVRAIHGGTLKGFFVVSQP